MRDMIFAETGPEADPDDPFTIPRNATASP
jgi:hypothetical protein